MELRCNDNLKTFNPVTMWGASSYMSISGSRYEKQSSKSMTEGSEEWIRKEWKRKSFLKATSDEKIPSFYLLCYQKLKPS